MVHCYLEQNDLCTIMGSQQHSVRAAELRVVIFNHVNDIERQAKLTSSKLTLVTKVGVRFKAYCTNKLLRQSNRGNNSQNRWLVKMER